MTNQQGRRAILICTAGAVVLAAIALVGWIRITDGDLDHVAVVPEAMLCDGKPVAYRIVGGDDPSDEDVPFPAFKSSAGPGTECTLKAVIANTGSQAVTLHTVTLEGMGVDASPMLKAVKLAGSDGGPLESDYMSDAIFGFNQKLKPGDSQRLHIFLEFGAGDNCRGSNYTGTRRGLQQVELSSWGRHRTIESAINLVTQGVGPENAKGC